MKNKNMTVILVVVFCIVIPCFLGGMFCNYVITKPVDKQERTFKSAPLQKNKSIEEKFYIGDLLFKKYHHITIVSAISRTYVLYSGISYYKSRFSTFGNIEYQVYPSFEGSYEDCLKQMEENEVKLNKKIESWK